LVDLGLLLTSSEAMKSLPSNYPGSEGRWFESSQHRKVL